MAFLEDVRKPHILKVEIEYESGIVRIVFKRKIYINLGKESYKQKSPLTQFLYTI